MKPTATRYWLPVLVALLITTGCVAAADAAPAPGLGINPPYGPPLTTVKLTGTGFCAAPCGAVHITVASVRVDSSNLTWHPDRTFTVIVQVPGSARPGGVPVVATQTDRAGNQVSARTQFAVTINVPAPTRYPTPTSLQPPGGGPGPVVSPAQPTPPTPSATPSATPSREKTPRPTSAATTATSSSVAPPPTTPAADHGSRSSSLKGPVLALIGLGLVAAAITAIWWRRRRRIQ